MSEEKKEQQTQPKTTYYANITLEQLAEGIKAVYQGYLDLTKGMNEEQKRSLDAELKKIINNEKIA